MIHHADMFQGPAAAWVPPIVRQRLVVDINTNEHDADAWLQRLPSILSLIRERWDLRFDSHLPGMSFNVVVFAGSQSLGPVIVKLHPPSPEFNAEIRALEIKDGKGCVRLVAADAEAAWIIERRVMPGTTMLEIDTDDDSATRDAAAAMRAYWTDVRETADLYLLTAWFRPLLDYPDQYGTRNGPLPAEFIRPAVTIARDLLASSRRQVLLHGDLHHGNLLRNAEGGWTVIDPKGLVGDPGYDVAAWMLNPWSIGERNGYGEIARRRFEILQHELGIPARRLAKWTFAHAALSICWGLADGDWKTCLNELGAVEALLPLIRELDGTFQTP